MQLSIKTCLLSRNEISYSYLVWFRSNLELVRSIILSVRTISWLSKRLGGSWLQTRVAVKRPLLCDTSHVRREGFGQPGRLILNHFEPAAAVGKHTGCLRGKGWLMKGSISGFQAEVESNGAARDRCGSRFFDKWLGLPSGTVAFWQLNDLWHHLGRCLQ